MREYATFSVRKLLWVRKEPSNWKQNTALQHNSYSYFNQEDSVLVVNFSELPISSFFISWTSLKLMSLIQIHKGAELLTFYLSYFPLFYFIGLFDLFFLFMLTTTRSNDSVWQPIMPLCRGSTGWLAAAAPSCQRMLYSHLSHHTGTLCSIDNELMIIYLY